MEFGMKGGDMKVKEVLLEFMGDTGIEFPLSLKEIKEKGQKPTPLLVDLLEKILKCDDLSEEWRKEIDDRLAELKKYQEKGE